jgi:hypothetical protein
VTAPGYANAEALAATLRGWADSIEQLGPVVELVDERLGAMVADLRAAAEWVLRAVELDRADLVTALGELQRRQTLEWDGDQGERLGWTRRQAYLAGLGAAVELVATRVPPVQRGGGR